MAPSVRYLSLNGDIVPYEQASIHILTPTVKYGAAVFEGIRGYWNEAHQQMYLFRLDDHLRRLQYAMRVMHFDDVYSLDMMRDAIVRLIKANDLRETVHIRMFAYLDGDGDLTATGPIGLAIAALPRPEKSGTPSGMHVGISSWQRVPEASMPARVKCISNYQNSRLAGLDAKAGGYDYALLLNSNGKVSEGQTSAFFMVRRGVPATSMTTNDILESITRETVLGIMRSDFSLPAQERAIDRSELYDAEEAFFCGSGPEIKPILSINRRNVGTGEPGPITLRLIDRYRDIVVGHTADHSAWRTPVFT